MRRYFLLRQLRRLDNLSLMHNLASISEKGELLVRLVGINFKETSPKAVSTYTAHLSEFAIDWDEYNKKLEGMKFPYKVEPGDFFVIKRVSDEYAQKLIDKKKAFAEKQRADLKKHEKEVEALRQRHLKRIMKLREETHGR